MMKYLQRLGKSLMLPVAVLPAAALLMGIGYFLDPTGWGAGNVVAAFFIKTGAAIIDKIPILFAIGVSLGMTKEKDGASALSGLVAYLVVTTLLSSGAVAQFMQVAPEEVPAAFAKIENPFIGILSGIIAAELYNKFHKTELPEFLAFFSGKRAVPIITSFVMVAVSGLLFFIWPTMFGGLTKFGEGFAKFGPVGAGLFGLFNRLLIPLGLHHTLNSIFFFNLIGINDIGRFWGDPANALVDLPEVVKSTYHVGMYQAGFFPVMMFGLPAAGLAMYMTAKPERKSEIGSLMLAAGVAAFVTGVTEPLEFAFMFAAPLLYALHAILTAISLTVVAYLGTTAGFAFSAGLIDYVLSLRNPNANNPLLLLLVGIVFAGIYFAVFYFAIKYFDLKTPGREDDIVDVKVEATSDNKFTAMAEIILEAIGGPANIVSVDNCATRLRLELNNTDIIDKSKVKASGAFGTTIVDKNAAQIVVGPKVEFVATALKELIK